MAALVIYVRFHDGRYHGRGDWPPSPARLFQALVAGAGLSGPLEESDRAALTWLEELPAPIIAVPRAWQPRRGVLFYMPNNDSDVIKGDPTKIAKIRTATKIFKPHFFDGGIPFLYAWPLVPDTADQQNAEKVCGLTERLYQLGRGIDMAWAWGERLDDDRLENLFATYPGQVFRPTERGLGATLQCACPGSLESLQRRYQATGKRFSYLKVGRKVKVVFRQPPKALFRSQPYNSPSSRRVFALCDPVDESVFAPWSLERAHELVVALRDAAVTRLKNAMPARAADIVRVLVGRKPDGANDCPSECRVRIIPLPSIGHMHADREIRRLLVETPSACPLAPGDIEWAFSGLDLIAQDGGEVLARLIRTDDGFLEHYGAKNDLAYSCWRTVTPAVLPEAARRRRIEPARRVEEAKAGIERRSEQERAVAAVKQALRHAGFREDIHAIRLQREPFDANGRNTEDFAKKTRFDKNRVWHVEIDFSHPVAGPLTIGDGRFLGLGVMAPVLHPGGIYAFSIASGLEGTPDPESMARAFRRAVMACAQRRITGVLPPFFSGHEANGRPARAPRSPHLAFAFDPARNRFLIIAPHILDRRISQQDEINSLRILESSFEDLREVRAGKAGLLKLKLIMPDVESDPVFARSRIWRSATRYRVNRHVRAGSAARALVLDIQGHLRSLALPDAKIDVKVCEGASGRGLEGEVTLEFKYAISGPLLLGRSRFLGGGMFEATTVQDPLAAIEVSLKTLDIGRA